MRRCQHPCTAHFNHFNSRTHVECDPIAVVTINSHLPFQLTHSRGVRHHPQASTNYVNDFNSRTHVECDLSEISDASPVNHFNSRTHVECDINIFICSFQAVYFNSRTHVECDITPTIFVLSSGISTHALTWSATVFPETRKKGAKFQLTHSRGVRRSRLQGLLFV